MKTAKKRILCGTDFSTHAGEAADVAAALARQFGDTVQLVHVVENKKLMGEAARSLNREAERLRATGATVKEAAFFGSPYEHLVDAASKGTVRMTVVSSLGRIAPSRFLVGSTAERTAESSPVPTLVVRGSQAFMRWAQGERPLNICVGHDFSPSADAALDWAKELAGLGPCNITVAHIWWPLEQQRRLGAAPGREADAARVQQTIAGELQERIERVFGAAGVRARVEPNWGRLDSALLAVAEQERADLMVVGTHQRHGVSRFWLGSVSRGVLHDAPMSVAVVPAPRPSSQSRDVPEIRRVLVTTDFSELGNRAIPHAYAALKGGGALCLLHVVEPFDLPGPTVPHYMLKTPTKKAHLQHISESLNRLRALVPADTAQRGVSTQVEVIESNSPAKAICEMAERIGADLICMASHGRSGLSKAVLGSVAQKVMTRTHRPVLVVRAAKE